MHTYWRNSSAAEGGKCRWMCWVLWCWRIPSLSTGFCIWFVVVGQVWYQTCTWPKGLIYHTVFRRHLVLCNTLCSCYVPPWPKTLLSDSLLKLGERLYAIKEGDKPYLQSKLWIWKDLHKSVFLFPPGGNSCPKQAHCENACLTVPIVFDVTC